VTRQKDDEDAAAWAAEKARRDARPWYERSVEAFYDVRDQHPILTACIRYGALLCALTFGVRACLVKP